MLSLKQANSLVVCSTNR